MENAKDMLTRRAATRLILGGPLAVGLARPVPAGPAHWAVRLDQRLKEMPRINELFDQGTLLSCLLHWAQKALHQSCIALTSILGQRLAQWHML